MAKNNQSPMTPFEFDSRMVEWNLQHKLITKEDLQKYLSSLPDESANAEAVSFEDESAESNGFDGTSH